MMDFLGRIFFESFELFRFARKYRFQAIRIDDIVALFIEFYRRHAV